MKTIAFVNQKGGVAKTTTTVNVGACLADQGFKVLLIDLSDQGSLSISFGFREIGADELTTYEVLKGSDIKEAIKPIRERLDILPTDIRLSGAELELASSLGREFLLREALEKVSDDYDFALIDCPQSLGLLTLIALTASDEIVVPVKADYLALNGMSQLIKTVNVVKGRLNPKLEIMGVVVTFYHSNWNLDNQIVEEIDQFFGDKFFKTKISQINALAEAPATGSDIFKYDPRSKGATQYKELTNEIIEREGLNNGK